MLQNNKKILIAKIILYVLYLVLLYLMTICGFFMMSHNTVNIGTLTVPIFVTIFFFVYGERKKGKERKDEKEKYIGLRVLFAIFIDIMSIVFIIGIFGIISVLLPGIFSHCLAVLLTALILGYNVFFISLGYKLLKIYCCQYKIPVLFYNAFFMFCFIGALRINNLAIYLIVGLYLGLDAFFLMIKKMPFVYYIFKINYYLI